MVVMRQKWTSEEAAALKAGIDKYGEGKWTKILKDPYVGPILHLRSNVDLKDKWRNFSPKANGLGSRHGVRGARRNTTEKKKRRGMSLKGTVVLSDPEIVATKPLTVLSETSEVSELSSIKESISRLDNAMVDAITYAKEPLGSSQTAVSTCLEKEEVAGVAGEYSDPPQELFEKGKRIEVLTREEGFSDSWYVATVIDSSPPLSHLNKYYVEYETLMSDYDLSLPLKERVDVKLIRPICPLTSVGSFRVGDIVDALYYDGWWIGIVTKALSNSRFKVKFAAPLVEHEFHASELRLHLDWVNGQWINPSTQTKEKETSELDSDTPKIVKKRGRLPKILKSLTTGYESITGVRTDEGIKEKHCEAKKNAPFSVRLARDETRSCRDIIPCQSYPVIDGNVNYPGVKIAEGTKEKECEMEDIAQIHNLLTCNGTNSPKDDTPYQFPPDESQPFIKGEGNVSPRLTIKIKKKEISELDGDTPKIVKRRGRPPKLHKSSTTGNESTAGVRTAEGIQEKHCEAKGFAPISVGLARYETRSRQGVNTLKGRKEKDCKMEEAVPMLLLTCDGMSSPQTYISNHHGEGNAPARLIIKESAEINLANQMETSPESLEPRSMVEISTESTEKAKCVVSSDELGKKGKASATPSTESSHSFVDANINPGIDVNQILPFKKTIHLWDIIESMEVFRLLPQKPHFRLLEYSDEDCREGLALGQMVTFFNIVKKIAEMGGDMPRSSINKCLENLIVLEDNGFDVRTIRDHLKIVEKESRITEFKEKKRKINEDVDEIEKKLEELQAKREAAMLKMEMRDSAIEASRLLLNNVKDRTERIQFDFKEVAVAPW